MKKLFLTTITACVGLFASAQFSMVSSINMPEDGEEWNISSITENMLIMCGKVYALNQAILCL